VPLYTADALILRTYKLGEADRIVVFLTRDRGKKRGVAKGARRSRSRFVGALEPLTEARVAYFENERRELVGLNYAETVRSPLAFLGPAYVPDHSALGYVGYFAELLDEWAQEADADERLYRLHHARVLGQLHAAHAPAGPRRQAQLLDREADGLAIGGDDQRLVFLVRQFGGDEDVVGLQVHGDEAGAAHGGELRERGLFHLAHRRAQHHHVLLEIARGDDGRHQLLLVDVDQVDQREALRLAGGVRHVERAELEDAAAVREEEQAIVRIGDDDAVHRVGLAGDHAGDAAPPTPLRAVRLQRQPLDVAALADRDHHLLVGDQVLL